MTARSRRAFQLAVATTMLAGTAGCWSWSQSSDSRFYTQGVFTDASGRDGIIREGRDRHWLRENVGEPAIDDGDEWIYLGKFEDVEAVPVTVALSVYDDRRPVWKMTVVTFDDAGKVAGIRVVSAVSEIGENSGYWTLFNRHFDKGARVRSRPATRPATRPSNAAVAADNPEG